MLEDLLLRITSHPDNQQFARLGYKPLFLISPSAKMVIVGQAPGHKAQQSGVVWNDASGDRLISWLGISPDDFRNQNIIAHLPMDFYYPGKGTSGDLPPRKGFAALWHPQIMAYMPSVELTILIGQYAQRYYLGRDRYPSLTETVRHYDQYLPTYFPLVHPSPLNFRWFRQNPWFETEVVPVLQATVAAIL